MKKGTVLNADISSVISRLGHTDTLVVCDAGLPVPRSSARIDMALTHGVPSFMQVLEVVTSEMQNPQWVDADAVVISDFIAQRLPDEVINKVGELQHKHQHRFHAVAMSVHGKPGIMRVFDHIWRFDTGLRSRLLRRWRR